MVMVSSSGLMAESIKVTGKMVNSTERVYISDLMVKKEKENGKKVRELNGLRNLETNNDDHANQLKAFHYKGEGRKYKDETIFFFVLSFIQLL